MRVRLGGPFGHPPEWAMVLLVTGLASMVPPGLAVPPMFNINSRTVWEVSEDSPANSVVGTLEATDIDGNMPLLYTLSNPGGGPFTVQPSSGDILVSMSGVLRTSSVLSYSVTVRVTDSRSEYSDVTFTLKVVKTNKSPTISVTVGNVSLNEELPAGTLVAFVFSASDENQGTSLTFSLIGRDSGIFHMDQLSGEVTLNSKIDIDPYPQKVFRPTLKVSDGFLSATVTLTLTIEDTNDHFPVCTPMVIYRPIKEGTLGEKIPLTCEDKDSAANGFNLLIYSITSGDVDYCSINSDGVVSMTNAIDYETTTAAILSVVVQDSAPTGSRKSTTVTIIIPVIPLNDNVPQWSETSSQNYTVSEDIAVGTTIFTMAATDADMDVGGTVTYSISSVTDGFHSVYAMFNVDARTGEVTTLFRLDADSGVTQYTFNLKATDGDNGPHVITRSVTLYVKDVNDNAPRFLGTPYAVVTIPESQAKSGLPVKMMSAADGDVTSTTLTYFVESVLQGNTYVSNWRFNTNVAGLLEFATDFDLDIGISAVSALRLVVKDAGMPVLSGTATLIVSISPDNEFSPTLVSQPGANIVQLAENQPVGTKVAEIICTDNDIGLEGLLELSITGGDPDHKFHIDNSGRIYTRVIFDTETMPDIYYLVVRVQDSGLQFRSVTTTVTVSVTDVNDNRPSCQFTYKAVSLLETSPRLTPVVNILCSDKDSSDVLTFSVSEPHDLTFGFPKTRSELQLLDDLDYDSAIQFYDVEVIVSDGTLSQTVRVRISVSPVNEATPRFVTNPSVAVPENVVLTSFITYTALDTDFSPHCVQDYSIQSVTNGGVSYFVMDSSSGKISLKSALDYDMLPATDKTFSLEIVARDGGGLMATGTVTVVVRDVNDNGPVCLQAVTVVSVSEKQTGPPPYIILPDLGCSDVENGTSLTYSLGQESSSHFTVTSSGRVELLADSLDYEAASSHTITIQVSDSGIPVKKTLVTVYVNVINVNRGGPIFPPVAPVYVDETIGLSQLVADVVATDPDGLNPVFGDLQYSIIGGNSLNHFAIDVQTGRILTRKYLDFETISSYFLVVQAKEKGGAESATVTQTVHLIDQNDQRPVCDQAGLSLTVLEDTPVDTALLNLSCSDKDAGTLLTYTITTGNTHFFKMESSQLKLRAMLDYESQQSHDISITVSDSLASHNLILAGTVFVSNVDEGPPVFTSNSYSASVSEALTISSVILTVTAVDPDSARGANSQVKYSIISSSPHYIIDSGSGQIILWQALDRETAPLHVLIIKAADALSFTTSTVSISVLDANDNPPKFSSHTYSTTILESLAPGSSVISVTATDQDDAETTSYGKVTYHLSGSNTFTISASTGLISTNAPLAFNLVKSYMLTVIAVDNNGLPGALTSSAFVLITVSEVNNHDPNFEPVTTTVNILENQFSVGDIVAAVTATDADSGKNGEFDMSFVNHQPNFSLMQEKNVGYILLAQSLAFVRGDTQFTLLIKAADHGSNPRSGTGTAIITVNDVNDSAPMCPSVINIARVEGDALIASLPCSDSEPNSVLTYSIVSTSPATITPMVSTTGVLSALTPLDYETSHFHEIVIKVQDNGSPVRSTSVTISLQVLDLNDHDPSLQGPLTFSLSESALPSRAILYQVTAQGNDGPQDVVTFSLSDTTYFHISPITGEITLVSGTPDYETLGGSYTTDVCVVDTANPVARTACEMLTVIITDANDMIPRFEQPLYSESVLEDVPIGTQLPPVLATDADSSPAFSRIKYSLVDGHAGVWRL